MKIVHFSDTHLGFSDLEIVNEEGVNQREADFYKAFSDIVDGIISLKPDFVIHTGDLFHRARPGNRAITFALKEFKRLQSANIPVVIIAGNHSTPRTVGSSAILEALESIENIYAVFRQRYEKIEFEDVIFHALPHINDENIINAELNKIEKNIDKRKKNILMMHCSTGAYYLMHEFGEWVYPKEKEYLFDKMDYVALGHWHGFGSVGKHKNVYYSGSSERTGGSDRRENKGYVVVDLKDSLKVEHISVNIRKSLRFEIDATNYDRELAALDKSCVKDAMIEVKLYNLTPSLSVDITDKMIKECFCDAMSVRIRREFISLSSEKTEENVESFSLESFFFEYLQESVKDEDELARLNEKAKKMFADITEADNDTD